jgi:hypothetical protein
MDRQLHDLCYPGPQQANYSGTKGENKTSLTQASINAQMLSCIADPFSLYALLKRIFKQVLERISLRNLTTLS